MEDNLQEQLKEVKEGQIDFGSEKEASPSRESLPTKTKIAAWWIRILGSILIILSLLGEGYTTFVYISIQDSTVKIGFFLFLIFGFAGLLLYVPSSRILKFRKNAWWITMTLISIGVIFCTWGLINWHEGKGSLQFLLSLLLLPFILFLLDRKNFWKIAT